MLLQVLDIATDDLIREILDSDCTGRAQAGIKWLSSSGYNLPPDIRLSYNAKLSYQTMTFQVSDELKRILADAPGPEDAAMSTHVPFVYSPHPSRGNAVFSIAHTDNDKGTHAFISSCVIRRKDSYTFMLHADTLYDAVQLLFAGYDLPELPHDVDEIKPFLEGFDGHEPIPSWVFTMVASIVEHGGVPTCEAVKTCTCCLHSGSVIELC